MKLTYKFTLAFLLVSLIAVGMAGVFIWRLTSFEFNRYLTDQRQNDFVEAASSYYQQNNSWAGVEIGLQQQGVFNPPGPRPPREQPGERPAQPSEAQASAAQSTQPAPPGKPQPQPPLFALVDQHRKVVIAGGNYHLGEEVPENVLAEGIGVEVDGQVVGTVLNLGQPLVQNEMEQRYTEGVNRALFTAAMGGVLIALILGGGVARTLTRPIKELTTATRSMASGKLEQQVPVRSKDELGELATSFNQMSSDLVRANQSRRQMTADIAHDLRNPLTVIGGYLESLKDGKLKGTPERFETMYNEVEHLQHLVEDLRTLSLADTGELAIQRQPVAAGDLLEHVVTAYQPLAKQQKIYLGGEVEANLPEVNLDPARMEQILGNLISNALRYTPEGGKIHLAAKQVHGQLVISVQDNGSGIASEDLPYIFERSYRGDHSRSGSESGLGLAIVKSMVELHGGSIQATSQPGEGTRFLIMLPIG